MNMKRVAIISDTHIPSRAKKIPEWVQDEVRKADHTIHAGDFTSPETLDEVRELADGNLTAVYGNMDPGSLDVGGTETVEVEGVEFVVVHGTGSPAGYRDRIVDTVRKHARTENAVGVDEVE
ncbi:MAG: YfcE family phosphodiesterase, partial [Halobacteria archaeon]|nr:YfcE family phosphodiesterase [Halobacteria archaeon]